MQRFNQVILDGQVSLKQVYRVERSLVVAVTVETDLAALGGVHRVLASDALGLEALAFGIVARAHGEGLLATVHGWLWSGEQEAHVVASAMTFHVRPEMRAQAVGALRWLREGQGELPESVPVNGWRVRLSEALADVEGIGAGRVSGGAA
jgi:hypothetical protein